MGLIASGIESEVTANSTILAIRAGCTIADLVKVAMAQCSFMRYDFAVK